jgi:phosphopantetheinyl transferase
VIAEYLGAAASLVFWEGYASINADALWFHMKQAETPSGDSLGSTWLNHDSWLASLARSGSDILHAVVVDIGDLTAMDASAPFEVLLDAEDRERAARFRFTEDRNRFVIAHAILRLVAGQATGIKPEALEFAGRPRAGFPPRLTALPDAPLLSLSHSGRYVAIALGRGQPVGIDVEWPRPLRDVDALAGAVLTETEARDLAALSPAVKTGVFLRWWTAKEAALKAQGTGFATPPDEVALCYDGAYMPNGALVPTNGSHRSYTVRVFDPFGPSTAIVAIAAAGYRGLVVTYTQAKRFALSAGPSAYQQQRGKIAP